MECVEHIFDQSFTVIPFPVWPNFSCYISPLPRAPLTQLVTFSISFFLYFVSCGFKRFFLWPFHNGPVNVHFNSADVFKCHWRQPIWQQQYFFFSRFNNLSYHFFTASSICVRLIFCSFKPSVFPLSIFLLSVWKFQEHLSATLYTSYFVCLQRKNYLIGILSTSADGIKYLYCTCACPLQHVFLLYTFKSTNIVFWMRIKFETGSIRSGELKRAHKCASHKKVRMRFSTNVHENVRKIHEARSTQSHLKSVLLPFPSKIFTHWPLQPQQASFSFRWSAPFLPPSS